MMPKYCLLRFGVLERFTAMAEEDHALSDCPFKFPLKIEGSLRNCMIMIRYSCSDACKAEDPSAAFQKLPRH